MNRRFTTRLKAANEISLCLQYSRPTKLVTHAAQLAQCRQTSKKVYIQKKNIFYSFQSLNPSFSSCSTQMTRAYSQPGAHRAKAGEGACIYIDGKNQTWQLFQHKRIVLLNIVTVDTKHSRKSAMFEFCCLRYSTRNCMFPRRLCRLNELLSQAST